MRNGGRSEFAVRAAHDAERAREPLEAEEARARLAAIVASSSDAIIGKDLDGMITSWNAAAERLFGWTATEAIGRAITLIIPTDRLAEEADILARLRRGERIEHYETVRRRKDGELLEVSLAVSPIADTQGRIIGASKVARDVTERRRTERALREQARTLATLHRVAVSVSANLDLRRLVQVVTDAGTELSGAEFGAFFYNVPDERGGSLTLYTLSGAPRDAFGSLGMPLGANLFDSTIRGEGVIRSDDITQDPRYGKDPPHYGLPEGHPPIRSYLAVPVISRSGEVLGGLFLGHSRPGVFTAGVEATIVTLASHAATAVDNARLYEQARRLNETLEDRVRQRTSELQHLNAELEAFNYSVSHDLRAPLRGISGFSQVLLQDHGASLPDVVRHYLGRIAANTTRMSQLIEGLLDLSRLSCTELRVGEVDLTALAHVTVAGLREREPDRDVEVTVAPGLVVRGDRTQLGLVIENLVGNAWKFTRHRNRARIEVGAVDLAGERAIFVRDDGVGFAPTQAGKLFAPFQRLHPRSEFEGDGVGLATVQRIVHRHGGRIWAESAPDAGATFYFVLPG